MGRFMNIKGVLVVLKGDIDYYNKRNVVSSKASAEKVLYEWLKELPHYEGSVENAIKKQIPMQPIKESDGWECPECHASNDYDEHDEISYCRCCGQAVKWNEEDAYV